MDPILVSVFDAAKISGFGNWHDFHRAVDDGDAPRPIYVSGRPRWRIADLQDWASRGCPAIERMSDTEYEGVYSQGLLADVKQKELKNE